MKIGTEIKNRRAELGLTQEELAQKLSVARTTISNWEIERNYPDLEMIVKISEVLGISLDHLLKGGSDVVQKIAEDTKTRKSQSKKIKVLSLIIGILVLTGVSVWSYGFYKNKEFETVSFEQMNIEFSQDTNTLIIRTDLPAYRSIAGGLIDANDPTSISVSVYSVLDLSMKNKGELVIELDENIALNLHSVQIYGREQKDGMVTSYTSYEFPNADLDKYN